MTFNPLLHIIFQMLSALKSKDVQIEKSGKLEVRQRVENIVIKSEIARFEQFYHLLQCFQKSSATAGFELLQCEVMG